jgi:NhaA family Na+:H+ antiporter
MSPAAVRPRGLTLLSIFFAAGTIPSTSSALGLAFPGEWSQALWRLKPDAPADFARLGPAAIPLMVLVAAACAGAAVGLWTRQRWGHRLAVGVLSINLLGDTLNALVRGDWRTLIGLPIGGAMIAYLLRHRIRAWFAPPITMRAESTPRPQGDEVLDRPNHSSAVLMTRLPVGATEPATAVPSSDADAPPLIERMLAPFQRFVQTESASGLLLLACTALALAWANSPWAESYPQLWETPLTVGIGSFIAHSTLHHLINDDLMAVFFFLVGLEIKREMLAGELASIRQAALPIAAAAGGMLVPALLYASLNAGTTGEPGWGVPMATDIAFALGVLALLGDRVPVGVRVFLAALAIVDDIGAVLVIAVFYSGGIEWGALAFAGALVLLVIGANIAGVRRPWAYAAIGFVLWGAVLSSGIHATIAGVLLAMTIPARTRIDEKSFLSRGRDALSQFEVAYDPGASPLKDPEHQAAIQQLERLAEQLQPPLLRLEHALHGPVAFGIMPLFALANAGAARPHQYRRLRGHERGARHRARARGGEAGGDYALSLGGRAPGGGQPATGCHVALDRGSRCTRGNRLYYGAVHRRPGLHQRAGSPRGGQAGDFRSLADRWSGWVARSPTREHSSEHTLAPGARAYKREPLSLD